MTGLLTKSFTIYYGVSNLLSGDPMISDINGTLGTVTVKDPIHTLQVKKSDTDSHTRTNVWGEYKNHSNRYIQGTTVPCDIK